MRRRARGLSLLEFAVVAALFAILAGVLLERLAYYQELAEKTHMEATFRTLNSALLLKVAEYMTSGQKVEYEQLARENPVDWLALKPENYAGTYATAPRDPPRGSWYFDRAGRTLVYQVRNGRHFTPDSRGLKQVRYRLELVGESAKNDFVGDSPTSPNGIKLSLIEPYRWFAP